MVGNKVKEVNSNYYNNLPRLFVNAVLQKKYEKLQQIKLLKTSQNSKNNSTNKSDSSLSHKINDPNNNICLKLILWGKLNQMKIFK